jgi:predicted permease
MSSILQDLRHAFRLLHKSPGFTLAAALCIALGIGANSATFSFTYAILFRQLPVKEPDQLVRIFGSWATGLKYGSFSYPDYADVRDNNDVFAGLIASTIEPFHLSAGDRNERIWGLGVSGNYFSELGVTPALGRGFVPEEDRTRGTHPVAVISHGLWQRRFGGKPDVAGNTIRLNGRVFSIIGVAPEGFHGTDVGIGADLWVPMAMHTQLYPGRAWLDSRGNHWIGSIIGRLKPGVTIAQARSAVNAMMSHLSEQYPTSNKGLSADLYPLPESSLHPVVRGGFVAFLSLMFAVVGAILLLACANVAGLLLARSVARRREISIRLALGAGPRRLVRQLLVESLLLSLLGGGFGLLLASWLIRLTQAFQPPSDIPLSIDVGLDSRVVVFTLAASMVTGVLFGLTPALASARHNLVTGLKDGAPLQSGGTSRLRQILVAGQVALSFVLLVGAALLVHSLQNVRNLDLGFSPDRQAVAALDLELNQYDQARGRQFIRSLKERLQSLPGVMAAGFAHALPLYLSSQQMGVRPEGYQPPPDTNFPSIDYNVVDEDYFRAMGISILEGRGFTQTDDEKAPGALVINQAFAQRFWPGQEPIGKRVRTGARDHLVVGVVKTGKYFSIGEDPKAFMYLPMRQNYQGSVILHVRTAGDAESLTEAIRKEVRQLDETLPVSDLRTMNSALGFALLPARLGAAVVSAFAFLALFLASVGLYGVVAYFVSQGTRDIGIRMAIGASRADVLRLVLRQGMTTTLAGLAVGLAIAAAATRLMTSLLYGISATDPLSYLAATASLAAVSLLAALLPARRAAKVDPVVALRQT